ncbi:hypothetical protein CC1G_06501 [Coprinopsis cinerea okayama7|uniref:Uncharacterized protein n=1 Tax=Coprinopsis cinerea (strain Okayama-7 / 130 / ATCC MYA-4618 / FGSC 9003) TaxID=240176 RepID=A8NNC3_COPC7|nr:hypothetical protein CC1G_06501 [Coprinopsis cinerea okayama7\|eukprot:XP_001835098.2 hypothetical protein CC1G_06501 [Coprinopsis cinerea okayama7\
MAPPYTGAPFFEPEAPAATTALNAMNDAKHDEPKTLAGKTPEEPSSKPTSWKAPSSTRMPARATTMPSADSSTNAMAPLDPVKRSNTLAGTESISTGSGEFWEADEDLTRIIAGQLNEEKTGSPPPMPEPMAYPRDPPLNLEFPRPEEVQRPWEAWQTTEDIGDNDISSGEVRPFQPIGAPISGALFPQPQLATADSHGSTLDMPDAPPTFPQPAASSQDDPSPAFPQYPRIPVLDDSEPQVLDIRNTSVDDTQYSRIPINDDSEPALIPPPPTTPPPFPSGFSSQQSQGSAHGRPPISTSSSQASTQAGSYKPPHSPSKPPPQPHSDHLKPSNQPVRPQNSASHQFQGLQSSSSTSLPPKKPAQSSDGGASNFSTVPPRPTPSLAPSKPAVSNTPAPAPSKPSPPKPSPPKPTPSRPEPAQQPSQISNSNSNTSSNNHHTRYVNMLLALDDIPHWYNLLASFFTWVLLAGFLLFPGTFTSLQQIAEETDDELRRRILTAVTHVPLYIIAWLCCGVGAVGMIWLWWRWMRNYIWLLSKIFVPGFLNGLAGVITTLVNVYGVQDGQFSTTAKVTIIVVSCTAGACGLLVLIYQFWLLRRVKAEHDRQMGKQAAGKHGEGILKSLVKTKNSEKKRRR